MYLSQSLGRGRNVDYSQSSTLSSSAESKNSSYAFLTCQQNNQCGYRASVLTIHMANILNVGKQDGHQDVQALCKRMGHSLNAGRNNFVSFSVFIFLLVDKMAHAAVKYTNHRDSNYRKNETKFIFQQYAKVSSFFLAQQYLIIQYKQIFAH